MVTKTIRKTREDILHAAAAAVGHAGAAGLRVDGVARSAGVNKRMIYHYFGDKRGLIRAVYELQAQRVLCPSNALRAETRGLLRLMVGKLLAADTAPVDAVSAAQLQQAIAILLPELMNNESTVDSRSPISPEQWQVFALDVVSLAFADLARVIFGNDPGSAGFERESKRLLRRGKPRYRIASASRLRR